MLEIIRPRCPEAGNDLTIGTGVIANLIFRQTTNQRPVFPRIADLLHSSGCRMQNQAQHEGACMCPHETSSGWLPLLMNFSSTLLLDKPNLPHGVHFPLGEGHNH